MKKLVKSWQQLLQARPSNGLPPTLSTPHITTPTQTPRSSSPLAPTASPSPSKREQLTASPISHDPSVLTIMSSSPQPTEEMFLNEDNHPNGAGPQGEQRSNPAKNRQKLLNLLSKVKKQVPQPAPGTAADPGVIPASASDRTVEPPAIVVTNSQPGPQGEPTTQPSGRFSNKNFVPVGEATTSNGGGPPQRTPSPIVHSDGDAPHSLRVCLPRGSIPRTPQTSRKTLHKKHKRLKLIVSVPRNFIRLKQVFPVRTAESVSPVRGKLVVSVPIEHMTKKGSHQHPEKKSGHHFERTEHVQTFVSTEHTQTVNSTEHAQKVYTTEHAQTVTTETTPLPRTVKPTHTRTVKSNEHVQVQIPTEHAQKVSSLENTHTFKKTITTEEPQPMEVDKPMDSHPQSALSVAREKQREEKASDTSENLANSVKECVPSTQPSVDYVPNVSGDMVMLLPYVYIDGVTDDIF